MTTAAFLHVVHTSHTEHLVVDALRRAGALTLSLVAEQSDGRIVGHVAVSSVSISDGSGCWYGIGPVSVLPACQRQGIGTGLLRQAIAGLRDIGALGCVVLGDPDYYSRFGFKPESALVLSGVPPVYFQALAFQPVLPSGVVSYHEAFAVCD